MKKLLLFSRDPGGANCIIPIARRIMRDKKAKFAYAASVFGKDTACSRYQAEGIPYQDMGNMLKGKEAFEDVKEFLKSQMPDMVVTGTSADDMTEKYLWKAASEMLIPAVVILDYWGNYALRFSAHMTNNMHNGESIALDYLPDIICIMDDFALEEMVHEGFPPEKIRVTGNPYLEDIAAQPTVTNNERARYRKQFDIDPSAIMVLFASEPIRMTYGENCSLGYTEETTLFELVEALDAIIEMHPEVDVCLVLRPHPKEAPAALARDVMPLERHKIQIVVDADTPPRHLIQCADAVVGMSSMFLLEASAVGVPFFSVQIGLRGKDPFPLSRMGIMKTILDREILADRLTAFLFYGKSDKIDIEFASNASNNILDVIEELLRSGYGQTCN